MPSAPSSFELDNWQVLASFLPDGWADQAWSLGAMQRARYIQDPAVLLRVLLIHLATGCSLVETSARAKASGLAQISSVGVFKRLRSAEPWLRWLAQQMRGSAELPLAMLGRRLRAVDATSVHEPGSTGTDWKVHWAVNLADLGCDFFQLTPVREGGETFRRVPVTTGDIMLGDRAYAAPPGVAHVVHKGGDVIVRWNRSTLPVFDRHGKAIDLPPRLEKLRGGAAREYKALVNDPAGGRIAGRLIAVRKSVEATKLTRRRLQRRAQRSRVPFTGAAYEYAEYFLIWTTLPAEITTAEVLKCYRLRWQIELVFKRMKSILGLGHLPKTDPVSAQAWLEGKLFVGLLVERMIGAAKTFSPWGYAEPGAEKPLAGV